MIIEIVKFVHLIVKGYNVIKIQNYNIMEEGLYNFREIIIIKNIANLNMEMAMYIWKIHLK